MAEEPELAAIRSKRMSDIQGGRVPGSNQEDEGKRQQAEEMRKSMLQQVLTPEARERLARIAIVKPDKSRMVEDNILRLAQSGKLQAQITEQQLIQMLEQVTSTQLQKTKVTIQRRRGFSDDEDDDDDF